MNTISRLNETIKFLKDAVSASNKTDDLRSDFSNVDVRSANSRVSSAKINKSK